MTTTRKPVALASIAIGALTLATIHAARAQSTVAGTYETAGGVTMSLSAQGRATFVSARGTLVDASYTVSGTQVAFRDTAGVVACPGAIGQYAWRRSGDTLRFTVVEDRCEGRRSALSRPWVRVSDGLALRGVTLIDGTGAPPREGMTVVMHQGRITAIGPDATTATPPGAHVRDLPGHWVTPGLIDAHVHVATNPSAVDRRDRAEVRLTNALRGGVVAVRDMGGDGRALADLARAAAVGDIASPLIVYSALLAGPEFFVDPRVRASSAGVQPGRAPWARAVTDSSDVRQIVAEARGTGATGVKLYADLNSALVAHIAREAHAQQLAVWSHVTVMPARPSDMVRGGVDVVSHAPLLAWEKTPRLPGFERRAELDYSTRGDDPVIQQLFSDMKTRGTALEPTLFVFQATGRDSVSRRRQSLASAMTSAAYRAGVRIVAGTDGMGAGSAGELPNIHHEMRLLVELGGLSTMDAILAATQNAAIAAGLITSHGTIAVGKSADLLVLRANPIADITNTQKIALVVQRGVIVR
jgi:imidazolonepropionase-like amidohydrolase